MRLHRKINLGDLDAKLFGGRVIVKERRNWSANNACTRPKPSVSAGQISSKLRSGLSRSLAAQLPACFPLAAAAIPWVRWRRYVGAHIYTI
jgi:uncharacterized protein involved in response to NO